MKYELKVLPQYFKAIWCGDKTFEIRLNDRDFEERDEITLVEKELGYEHEGFTGREVDGVITYLTDYEQKSNYVVFSFRETARREE